MTSSLNRSFRAKLVDSRSVFIFTVRCLDATECLLIDLGFITAGSLLMLFSEEKQIIREVIRGQNLEIPSLSH